MFKNTDFLFKKIVLLIKIIFLISILLLFSFSVEQMNIFSTIWVMASVATAHQSIIKRNQLQLKTL